MCSNPRIAPLGGRASAGNIVVGGLAEETTDAQFYNHFGKYGEIKDSMVMRNRRSGQSRGFGFLTYADPSAVDKVIQEKHVINGKQVEITRTPPEGSEQPKELKTKIFVGGIPLTVTDDELKDPFLKHGEVIEHQTIRDHETNRSQGLQFIRESAMGSKPTIDPLDDGASAGSIFVGGLAEETTNAQFYYHFRNYGEITNSVVMKDWRTGRPRGYGFVNYADPSAVDKVIQEKHVINGKQVGINRAIPRGSEQLKELKRKRIFVGGIPRRVTDDELKDFFSKHGEVIGHQIKRDRETNRSRGFGFVTFKSEEVVEKLLSNGDTIDMAGIRVRIKKAEPNKPSDPSSGPADGSNSRFGVP